MLSLTLFELEKIFLDLSDCFNCRIEIRRVHLGLELVLQSHLQAERQLFLELGFRLLALSWSLVISNFTASFND